MRYSTRRSIAYAIKFLELTAYFLILIAAISFMAGLAFAQVATVTSADPDSEQCSVPGICLAAPLVVSPVGSFTVGLLGEGNKYTTHFEAENAAEQLENRAFNAELRNFQIEGALSSARANVLSELCGEVFPFPDGPNNFLCRESEVTGQVVVLISSSETQKLPADCTSRRGGECGEVRSLDGDLIFPSFWRTIANEGRGHFDIPTSTEALGDLFEVIFRYPRVEGGYGCIVIGKNGVSRVD
jgi:hypothetical protein